MKRSMMWCVVLAFGAAVGCDQKPEVPVTDPPEPTVVAASS